MPNFNHNLMGIGKLCDPNCKVLSGKTSVTVFFQYNVVILHGRRELAGSKLWRFSLLPQVHPSIPTKWRSTPSALNAHDLPIIGSLVYYFHTASRFPVKYTWLADIHSCNFASWPGITFATAAKYCPVSGEALKGHLTQSCKGVRSTKRKPPLKPVSVDSLPGITSQLPAVKSQELHVWVEPISKFYTDDMVRLSVRSRCGNQ